MSLQDDVKTILAANATLTAAFTGGIKIEDELGGQGLNRTQYPAAFDTTTGKLKPTLILRERALVPTRFLVDEAAQTTSFQQGVEIALYNDRVNGYATLESAQNTIYGLLHNRKAGNVTLLLRQDTRMNRDRNIDNACILLCIYEGHGIRTP